MSMIINHNLSAMQSQRNLGASNNSMTKSIEKLSSGYRINVGADDPSGLIISEQLRSQISGLERAVRNSSEASNLIGIAEGALNEMNEILKKMKALAIHASNNGITSPEQVAADQAEMDSGIQTLERIANTTRYSDQYLLNGSKQLVYDVDTVVDDPGDHQMLNTEMTRVDQVFKRDGVKMTLGYTGKKSDWQANSKTSAQRAYFEAEPANSLCEIKGNQLTADQEFVLTGTKGSRLFSFSQGTNVGTMVASINNVKDSTGVGATMIFPSDVRIDQSVNGGTAPVYAPAPPTAGDPLTTSYADPANAYIYNANDVQIYGASLNNPAEAKISSFQMTPDAASALRVGFNCDGDGKIYAKVVDKASNSIEYYKDKDCTMLIGKGSDTHFSATNNSGIPSAPTKNLDGIFIDLTEQAQDLDVYEIAVVGQRLDNEKDFYVDGVAGWSDVNNSIMSGVNLGYNTSPEGQLFFKYSPLSFENDGTTVKTFKVDVYNNSSMLPSQLVASSGTVPANVHEYTDADGNTYQGQSVRIESVVMANGLDSGLNITLNIPAPSQVSTPPANSDLPNSDEGGNINFTNVGIRLYADDYGSQNTIRLQNKKGNLFYHYRESETLEKVMVKPETTVQIAGQDATINLNGAPVLTNGLVANTTTPDFAGSLAFNAGALGLTTIAVAGYEYGSLYSKATALQAIEENEITIVQERRDFEPPSRSMTLPGLKDKDGADLNVYLDLSQLDPTVEAKITPPKNGAMTTKLVANGTGGFLLEVGSSLIDGGAAVQIPVTPAMLASGFYATTPDLKGLYIKASGTPDFNQSTATAAGDVPTFNFSASGGNNLKEVTTWATNPRSNTTEDLTNFLGGMQFQLGNTEGDQDRTVYSIQSMVMANVGRLEYDGKQYCLQDVLGGGQASLQRDPIMAMRIVTQAIDDVTTLRARLGAFQKNILETNINSLNVAIENITKTESAIRDTDMAAESTEFTKNQIMVNAGTSMLAQANQVAQNVLSLLGGR